jgi:flagellar M-ring protein FliF
MAVANQTQPNQSLLLRVKHFWATRTQNQRVLLVVGIALTAALLALFTQLMMTPDMKPLMSGMEPADAQALGAQLAAKKIAYQLSPDGKSISVAADQLDAARLEVASGQSPHSGRMGFEIFDKVSWGQTEFDEKVNYQRALEGELERTIMTLSGIKSARVHLVLATDSVFIDRDRGAKASVALSLSRGALSREEASSIARLVAGAVDGLKATDVSIVDADTNEALGGRGTGFGDGAGGEGEEQELTRRLVATLAPVVGADHLRASVNVEYDLGTTEESQDKYDPAVTVPLTVQHSEDQSGPGAGVGGVPGTSSNVPQTGAKAATPATPATPGKPATPAVPNVQTTSVGDSSSSSRTDNTTYGVNKITRHSIEPAGRVRRLSAALVVDDYTQRKQGPKGKWIETRLKRSPEELKQIQDLAEAAIGFDATRGDVMTVQDMSFDQPPAIEIPPATIVEKIHKGVADYSQVIRYAMLLVLFVLAYVFMIKPVQQRALSPIGRLPAPDGSAAATPALEQAAAHQLEAPAPIGPGQVAALKQEMVQMVKAEPTASTRAVQVWLRGES